MLRAYATHRARPRRPRARLRRRCAVTSENTASSSGRGALRLEVRERGARSHAIRADGLAGALDQQLVELPEVRVGVGEHERDATRTQRRGGSRRSPARDRARGTACASRARRRTRPSANGSACASLTSNGPSPTAGRAVRSMPADRSAPHTRPAVTRAAQRRRDTGRCRNRCRAPLRRRASAARSSDPL